MHDTTGHTLTVWWDDPAKEQVCAETTDEVVLINGNKHLAHLSIESHAG
jgi:hypothetical protein